jgi:hypothetical protein
MPYVGPIHSSPKEKICQTHKAYVQMVAAALIPVVSSNETSLRNHG